MIIISSREVFFPYTENLDPIFTNPAELTFFVGAGISIDPPANLLPAKVFSKYLLELCAVPEEMDNLLQIPTLRYEMMVDIIQRYFDSQLDFMDYFEQFTQPNLIHYFLAHCIQHGAVVATTNFDYLIEHALLKIIDKESQANVTLVLTNKDFERYSNPATLWDAGKLGVYKIHGAKRNIITNMKTTDSLMTSLSAFGKGPKILSLDPSKEELLRNAIGDRTLVILGYSGSDDFDISPLFRQLFNLKRLIWIDHVSEDATEVFEFNPKASFVIPEGLSQSERFLALVEY